jgi:HlyD family secretion protein
VLYVGRPVHGQADSTIGIFKIIDDGSEAVRVNVKLGRSSVNTIEVVEGLKVGDKVILSDMSQWDNYDRIRLK